MQPFHGVRVKNDAKLSIPTKISIIGLNLLLTLPSNYRF